MMLQLECACDDPQPGLSPKAPIHPSSFSARNSRPASFMTSPLKYKGLDDRGDHEREKVQTPSPVAPVTVTMDASRSDLSAQELTVHHWANVSNALSASSGVHQDHHSPISVISEGTWDVKCEGMDKNMSMSPSRGSMSTLDMEAELNRLQQELGKARQLIELYRHLGHGMYTNQSKSSSTVFPYMVPPPSLGPSLVPRVGQDQCPGSSGQTSIVESYVTTVPETCMLDHQRACMYSSYRAHVDYAGHVS